jgi:hypothetical protein
LLTSTCACDTAAFLLEARNMLASCPRHHNRPETLTILPWSSRRSRPVVQLALLIVAVAVAGCGSDSQPAGAPSDGSAGTGGGGGAGGAGGVDGGKDPAAVRSAGDCVYDDSRGPGGANGYFCPTVTVVIQPGVEAGDQVAMSTDLQAEAPVATCGMSPRPSVVPYICVGPTPGNPASSSIRVEDVPPANGTGTYAPTTVTVRISRAGATIAQKTFSDLQYRCVAYNLDDWCWQAAPVTFTRTP